MGGGQDRDQAAVALDMAETKRDALHAAAGRGAVVLAVCGGYQLLGHSYQLGDEELPGAGLVDLRTVREQGPRLIGNCAIEADLGGGPRVIAGLREPRRAHLSRRGRAAARPRAQGPRQQRPGRLRGRAARQRDRHLPARPAAAQERLARRPPDRAGARTSSSSRSTTRSRTPPTPRPAARPASRLAPMDAAAFVTGGSGFIGGHARRAGWSARAGRSGRLRALSAPRRRCAALGAEPVRGDLDDVAAIRAGAEGCELAFHAAAAVLEWGPREEFVRGNVTGTENVLRGCREAGVRRLVHVGTEAALMVGQPLVQVDESAPLRPDSKAHYPATKALAEQRVRAATGDGFETVVVRPRLVWGPGDTTILPGLAEAVKKGRFSWIGGGRHLTDTTHVDNVVEGLAARRREGPPGRGLLRHRRRAGRVPRVRHEAAGDAGRRGARAEHSRRSWRGWRRRSWRASGACSPRLGAAGHAPGRLALVARVHDRHLEGALRARLRAGDHPRGGAERRSEGVPSRRGRAGPRRPRSCRP